MARPKRAIRRISSAPTQAETGAKRRRILRHRYVSCNDGLVRTGFPLTRTPQTQRNPGAPTMSLWRRQQQLMLPKQQPLLLFTAWQQKRTVANV